MSHVSRNRIAWNRWAKEYAEPGRTAWDENQPKWGIWGIPESEAQLLPNDLKGLDSVELGCGTAYVSSWLARRGARAVGVDASTAQLGTAQELQREHQLFFPLVEASAEEVPFIDNSFDFAISEYGASIWCDPYRWIPEAARLLRPGGKLVFIVNGTMLMLCLDERGDRRTAQLQRDYFGMNRFEFSDGEDSVEFHLGYGDWIRLLKANGLVVEDLKELRPKEGSKTRWPYVDLAWARRWPSEEVWISRKVD